MPLRALRASIPLAILTCLVLPLLAGAQSVQQRSPVVSQAVHHDVSLPLYLIPPAARQGGQRVHDIEILPRPSAGIAVDPVVQRNFPTVLAPVTILNLDGVGQGFTGPAGTFTVNSAPPDTDGDVGPNHFVQIVNTDIAIFNKSGTAILGPTPTNTLWSGFGGLCQTDDDGDGVVVYDKIADRWLISQFAVTGANGTTVPFLQCVAVSTTPDPTGSYNRYSFGYSEFNDYPKIAVWPDAYYATFNLFNGRTFAGGQVCAYDRAKMLAGLAATQQCFNVGTNFGGLLPADLDGAMQPPAGSPNYVLALGVSNNDLAFWKFHVDWTTPANTTLTGPATITVATYNAACNGGTCIPQTGTTQQLDSLADRLMYRLAYRNFGTHESLVVNHSVTSGTGTGVRWYEIRSPGTTPTVFQQGTYAPDSNFRWMGSIAMDQSGNMALGFSLSGSGLHPEIHYTGRLASDPLGQMAQGEGTIIDGAGSQTTTLSRWGDYSLIAVDPTDDCTFWYTNEYIPSNGKFNWKTRIGSFKFTGCGAPPANDFSISASPASLSLVQGTQGMSTISTTVVSGTAETINLTASGVPSGATATFSPTSVTAGGSSTLTVNAGTAATGTYTLTVTGTAPSATRSTSVTLSVTHAPAITSANSTTFTVGQAGSFTVTTTGNPTPSITESGALPNGVTFHDNGNGTGTLSGTPATGTTGTYNITFTAANGVGSNAMQSFTLTVNPTPAPTLSSIAPTGGAQGASVGVTLTGTNFIAGATINLSGSGITPSGVTVMNSTTITATFTIAANAPLGAQNVSVTTSGGTSGTVSFTVNSPSPTLTSISPPSGVVGTSFPVTLTGTSFVAGQTTVSSSILGLKVTNVNVTSTTQITATFTIAADTVKTSSQITVTTPNGTSGAVTFNVYRVPTLTSISPTSGAQGANVGVTLTGTNFVSPATVNFGGAGVTVANTTVASATTIMATFQIAANAAAGLQNVSVTTPGGTTGNVSFTVNGTAPTLSTISPTSGNQGQTITTVTLTGTNLSGATINALNGITVSNVVATATQVTATFAIAASAPLGGQSVTVTTAGGTSNGVTFTVNAPPPTLSTISPTSGNQGQTITTVTLTGTNLSGATINALNGITVSNVVATATQVTATFAIAASAPLGGQSVTVTTAGGTSNGVTFTVNSASAGAPTLTGLSPSSGIAGTAVGVTLTGTNFIAGKTTISSSAQAIAITNVTVVSSTQMTATFTIAFDAVKPSSLITVTTPNGTSGAQTFNIYHVPTLTSISPSSGARGTNVSVTLTGTNFVSPATVNFSGAGVMVTNVTVVSGTTITATFQIAANAATGAQNVSVTTPGGTSGVAVFTVN